MGRKKHKVRRYLLPVCSVTPVSFVDTVVLTMPKLMPKRCFNDLRRALVRELRPLRRQIVWKRFTFGTHGYFFNLYVHQPTSRALEVIAGLGEQARISQVHIALDLTVSSKDEAELLRRHLAARLLVSDRPKTPTYEVKESTTYFNRHMAAGVEVALYADRLSKGSGEPCCHVEWRIKGAGTLRKFGLESAEKIANLKLQPFWQGVLRLSRAPTVDRLAEARERELRDRGLPVQSARQDAAELLSSVAGKDGDVSSHNLRCKLREMPAFVGRRAYRLFVAESTHWLIPSNTVNPW